MSVAVWEISGVCSLVSSVPFDFRKFSRCGICSRSDGTFGLSRVKCVLSKTMLITCWTPLPRWQLDDAALELLLGPPAAWVAGTAATCHPIESAATAAGRLSRFIPYPLRASRSRLRCVDRSAGPFNHGLRGLE